MTPDRLCVVIKRTFGFLAVCLAVVVFATPDLHAQTLTVFDDALQNGFADYSYGGGSNFAATSPVHSGTKSISILGQNFNALSFEHAPSGVITPLHVSTTPILRFWVNGGTSSGQQFYVGLQLNNVQVGNAALDTYITGGGVGAGVWRSVSIDLRQAPFNSTDFDRIDIQSQAGGTADPSATYFDDVVLGQPTGTVTSPIQYGQSVTVSNMSSETFTWQDSLGHPRFAALAYNDTAPYQGTQGGALRQYKYQLTNGQTRTATVTTYGNGGYGGFGYVTDHSAHYIGCAGDDSPLGLAFAGHWQRIFEGKHHAIFRFTQNYQRNCPAQGSGLSVVTRYLPVTIDWMFTTGHDHPLWAITYDVDLISDGVNPPVPTNSYYDDSRAPYGELNIDGDGFTYDINGTSWGDRYKFIPGNAPGTSMTLNAPWAWTATNTVPWVKEWIDAALGAGPGYNGDATMGIVQTQTLTQQDAGGARDPGVGSDITPYWTHTDAAGIHSAGPNKVPNGDNWPFQANGDNLTGASGNNNARLTWKTQYGFIGQSTYTMNNGVGTTAPGYPKKSYSTYIVLGQHSVVPDPVDAQVTQVETVQSLTLSASTGSVVTSGPAGNAPTSGTVTYAPAGYNHVYGALAFQANGNALDANVNVGSGTLNKPLVIVSNYTSASEPVVMLGGTTLVADTDYFDSLRPSANELWITFNSNFAGATNHIQIQAPGGISAPTNVVATAASSTSVAVTWTAVGGAASYTVYRSSNNSTYSSVGTPATNSFTDTTASPNTAYLYKVTATGAGTSGDSNKDLATTVIYTNASLTAQRIKAVDVTELRTAVNAVRKLANGGVANDFSFTDPTLTVHATMVKRLHVIDLRTALDAARSTLGLSALAYTDSTITVHSTPVKAIHLTDLRNGVK